ncbi:MAG TPA: DUF1080 domain-containing protein [Verrucomicrobiae bacterium]|nr:DUF1080 domain-containing protein [Verrucomicrobiae bacterium]
MTKSFQPMQNLARITVLFMALSGFNRALLADVQQSSSPKAGEHPANLLMHLKPMEHRKPPAQKIAPAKTTRTAYPAPPTQGADGEPRGILAGPPPSDAIVLFDGKDLYEWLGHDNTTPKWTVTNGVLTVLPKSGYLHTKRTFGDCQLHVEWATPQVVVGDSQGRGNSGIFLQGRYEIQVLDSFQNKTYYDGQAGSVYRQYPPLVNACRGPGEWQTYDIIYHAPRFDADGKLTQPASVTVLQNGVLVQDHVAIKGNTMSDHPTYTAHGKAPIELQDHGNPVHYRNIWIREL